MLLDHLAPRSFNLQVSVNMIQEKHARTRGGSVKRRDVKILDIAQHLQIEQIGYLFASERWYPATQNYIQYLGE